MTVLWPPRAGASTAEDVVNSFAAASRRPHPLVDRLGRVVQTNLDVSEMAQTNLASRLRGAARVYARGKLGAVERVMADASQLSHVQPTLNLCLGYQDYPSLLREIDYVAMGGGANFEQGVGVGSTTIAWLCLEARHTAIHIDGLDKPIPFEQGSLVVMPAGVPHAFMHPSVRRFTPAMVPEGEVVEALCMTFVL